MALVPRGLAGVAWGAAGLRRRGRARRAACAVPAEEGGDAAAQPRALHADELLLHGPPARGRLHAGQGGAAARDCAGLRRAGLHRARARWPGHPRAVARLALHLRLRHRLSQRDERARPGPRAGPAGPARLRGPQRRRVSRAARRPAARAAHGQRRRAARAAVQRAVEALAEPRGAAHRVRHLDLARAAQEEPRGHADDVGLRLERRLARWRLLPGAGLRAQCG